LILSDDQGYGDLSCYGGTHVRTPRIDSLAAKGVRFTRYYANAPECTPTRTALLTGRYQHRVGGLECAIGVGNVGRYDEAEWLQQRGELGLPASQSVLASSLKQAGYATACIGKWHLGYDAPFAPRRHGFDAYWGPLGGTVDYFQYREPTGQPMLYRDEKPERSQGYLTDRIADEAVAWLDRQRGPFFLYVPFTAPHTPYQHEDDAAKEVNEKNWNQGDKATYARMIARLDHAVGRILDALDKSGCAANTLVIFASDNGATRMGNNGGFRGNKGQLFEGGIRVPCLARWPGVLPENQEVPLPAITMDWTATILHACGARASHSLDGVDLLPALRNSSNPVEKQRLMDRELFFRYKRMNARRKAMIATGWKYLADGDQEYLFHLAEDPYERSNRIEQEPERAERMRRRLTAWEAEVRAPRLRDFRG
jgi:N-acetylgalactosamine-6-sulfatase